MKFKITADRDYDLAEVYDRIRDGALDDLVTQPQIDKSEKRPPLFGSGNKRIIKLQLDFKETPTTELIEKILAALRLLTGSKAHIEMIE